MRNTTINHLFEAAKKDPNIILMTADLGYSVMEKFMAELPKQFINTGIAEQNMIGVAAGLALSGKKVFVYTIAPFATMRCFEQIRVDVCYQNVDVTIIGVGGGFAYGTLGTTHYALEDLALMRALPNMRVMCPADPHEAAMVFETTLKMGGPSYIRLNRGGEMNIADAASRKKGAVGNPVEVITSKKKTGAAVFACGNILAEAHKAVSALGARGKHVSLFSVPFLKPLNKKLLKNMLKDKKTVFAVEEHSVIGGLGSAIAEVIAEEGLGVKLVRLGVADKYFDFVGKQDHMRDAAGISAKKIEKAILKYE